MVLVARVLLVVQWAEEEEHVDHTKWLLMVLQSASEDFAMPPLRSLEHIYLTGPKSKASERVDLKCAVGKAVHTRLRKASVVCPGCHVPGLQEPESIYCWELKEEEVH